MTIGGWVVMILSISSVLVLVIFCLFKVLSLPPVEAEDRLREPPEVDTRGTNGPN